MGLSSYWLVGTLKTGDELPRILGIYPNTVWAVQGEMVKDEVLGRGGPKARFMPSTDGSGQRSSTHPASDLPGCYSQTNEHHH